MWNTSTAFFIKNAYPRDKKKKNTKISILSPLHRILQKQEQTKSEVREDNKEKKVGQIDINLNWIQGNNRENNLNQTWFYLKNE